MKAGTTCEWPIMVPAGIEDGWHVYEAEPCGKPARWMIGDIPVCSEHYDLIHGIGDRV